MLIRIPFHRCAAGRHDDGSRIVCQTLCPKRLYSGTGTATTLPRNVSFITFGVFDGRAARLRAVQLLAATLAVRSVRLLARETNSLGIITMVMGFCSAPASVIIFIRRTS